MIGRLRNSARWKSSSSEALSALSALASPNCSIRRSGFARCAAAVAASEASTMSSILVSSSGMLNVTSADRRSLEIWPSLPAASGSMTSFVSRAASIFVTTSLTPAWNAASSTVSVPLRACTSTCSSAFSGKSARLIAASAVREEPLPVSSSASSFVPIAPPSTNAITTKASQPPIAIFLCRALQCPARAARFLRGTLGLLDLGSITVEEAASAGPARQSRTPAFRHREPHRLHGGAGHSSYSKKISSRMMMTTRSVPIPMYMARTYPRAVSALVPRRSRPPSDPRSRADPRPSGVAPG